MMDSRQGLAEDVRVFRAKDTAWRVVEQQAVVVSTEAQRVRVLNRIGSAVWTLCEGNMVSEIVDRIVEQFKEPRERVAADVLEFLGQLLELKMIVLKDPNSTSP